MCSTAIYLGRLDSTQVGAIVLSDGSFYSQKLANSIFGAVILPLTVSHGRDSAFLIYQVNQGPSDIAVSLPSRGLIVLCDGESDAEPSYGIVDVDSLSFKAEFRRVYSDHDQPTILAFLLLFVQVRDGGHTVDAAVGPKINQHNFAAQLGQTQWFGVDPAFYLPFRCRAGGLGKPSCIESKIGVQGESCAKQERKPARCTALS